MPIDLDEEYLEELFDDFPGLNAEPWPFIPESKPTTSYNCYAWALQINDRPVSHRNWWPADCDRKWSVSAYLHCFSLFGFEQCNSPLIEVGYAKVALYVEDEMVKHAARQDASGKWTSKLGKGIDLLHELGDIEGDFYGKVSQYLRRPSEFVVPPADSILTPYRRQFRNY